MAETVLKISDTVVTVPKPPVVLMYNWNYVKSIIGLLKLGQVILGAICMIIMGYFFCGTHFGSTLFFFLMTTTFCVGSLILFMTGLRTANTGEMLAKSYYEVIYNRWATGMILASSLNLLLDVTVLYSDYYKYTCSNHNLFIVASVIGLVNSIFYAYNASLSALRFNAN